VILDSYIRSLDCCEILFNRLNVISANLSFKSKAASWNFWIHVQKIVTIQCSSLVVHICVPWIQFIIRYCHHFFNNLISNPTLEFSKISILWYILTTLNFEIRWFVNYKSRLSNHPWLSPRLIITSSEILINIHARCHPWSSIEFTRSSSCRTSQP